MDSFQSIVRWLEELRDGSGNENLNVMLIGNKSDLKVQRQVPKAMALE
jgi:GTPase SAR1 family protein